MIATCLFKTCSESRWWLPGVLCVFSPRGLWKRRGWAVSQPRWFTGTLWGFEQPSVWEWDRGSREGACAEPPVSGEARVHARLILQDAHGELAALEPASVGVWAVDPHMNSA